MRLGLAVALLVALPVFADQGALTIDVGAGASMLRLQAPYASPAAAQVGTAPAVSIDGRYALTNSIELVATGFFDTSVPFYVVNSTIASDAGRLTGTLEVHARRFGLLGGARFLQGNIWRLIVGGDAGWALSSYSAMRLFDLANPGGARDFGLSLPDSAQSSLVVAPYAGVEWVGDKLSVSILPRFEAMLGGATTWAITIPVTVGWDWYL